MIKNLKPSHWTLISVFLLPLARTSRRSAILPCPFNQTSNHQTQHTTQNTQHTTHNTQHTTHNTQHTTHNTQHTKKQMLEKNCIAIKMKPKVTWVFVTMKSLALLGQRQQLILCTKDSNQVAYNWLIKSLLENITHHNEKNRTNSILHPPHMIIMKLSCCWDNWSLA